MDVTDQPMFTYLQKCINNEIKIFQPEIIKLVGDNNHCVLVVCGLRELLIFKFRNFSSAIQASKGPHSHCFIKIESPVLKIRSTILDTFLLMENGHVYHFETYKLIKQLDEVKNCIDITTDTEGNSMFMLCKIEGNLTIKVFWRSTKSLRQREVYDCGPVLGCCHPCILRNVTLTIHNKYLFKLLSNEKYIMKEDQAQIFTVGSIAYVFLTKNSTVGILKQFTSNIQDIWYSDKLGNVLLVMTDSGFLELSYYNETFKMIETKSIFIDQHIYVFERIGQDTILYSNLSQIIIVKIVKQQNSFTLLRQSKEIQGVISISYSPLLNVVYVLTENKLLYEIDPIVVVKEKEPESENFIKVDDELLIKTKHLEKLLEYEVAAAEVLEENYQSQTKWKEGIKKYSTKSLPNNFSMNVSYSFSPPRNIKTYKCVHLSKDKLTYPLYISVTLNSHEKIMPGTTQFLMLVFKMHKKTKMLTFDCKSNQEKLLLIADIGVPIILPTIKGYITIIVGPQQNRIMLKVPIDSNQPELSTFFQRQSQSFKFPRFVFDTSLDEKIRKHLGASHRIERLYKKTERKMFSIKLILPSSHIALEIVNELNLTEANGTKEVFDVMGATILIFIKENEINAKSWDCGAIKLFKTVIGSRIVNHPDCKNCQLDPDWKYKSDIKGININHTKTLFLYNKLRALPSSFPIVL